ncbi:alpha/beta hydrolase [Nocardiopsis sp. YSL2]|uniref:alpha/beta hydrolase n=1 Tax=Nocardiopsis sp. YSL2 TaxID=2939492 RepID=UPI0026F47D38|nr:alpha/beta hydrolase [Nocardiopsis sp. YSL2]
MQPIFVLVHSPSLGPSTWRPVAEHLAAAGFRVRVPSLLHTGTGGPPFWPRVVEAVRDDLWQVPADSPVTLVAHSNAGLFLPTVSAGLDHPVAGSVFVDAALPALHGDTPAAPPGPLEFLRSMAVDGRLPRWTDWWDEAQTAPMFPDPSVRRAVVEEQPTLPLSYFEQRIPVPGGWDDHPCSYLWFSTAYDGLAAQARERGWAVAHLHQIVDPAGTVRRLVELATTP